MRRRIAFSISALLIAILACNTPGTAGVAADVAQTIAAQTVSAALTAAVGESPTPEQSPTPGPSPTFTQVVPTATSTTAVACNLAHFVSDVTVPDNTTFKVNENFTKTWRLQNVGTCTWTSGYSVVFDSGDQMNGPGSFQLTNGTVAPNQTIDISVDLKAPGSVGTYKGNWKLREPGGLVFGLSTGAFYVQIKTKSANVSLPDWPLTKSGDTGPVVKALQHLLKQAGQDLTADGIFGPITVTKVQAFQSANGLNPDGIVGPLTWPKLTIQRQQGASGQAVRAIQVLLSEKYGYGIAVDGVFGPATNDAVRDFQDKNGLAVDGIVGPQTWRMMIGK